MSQKDFKVLVKFVELTEKYLSESKMVLEEISPSNFDMVRLGIQPFLQTLKFCLKQVSGLTQQMQPPAEKSEDAQSNNVIPMKKARRPLELD